MSSVQASPDPYAIHPGDAETPPTGLGSTLRRIGPGVVLAASIVGSGELIDTPVLLVTASGTGGVRAGAALAPVIEVIAGHLVGPISIWGVSPKVTEGRLTDPDDLDALAAAVELLLSPAPAGQDA